MKTLTALTSCGLAAGMLLSTTSAFSACGHDVHGAPSIEVTQLGDNTSVMHYFSPATIVMDNPKDPRHRAFGECRGQGVTINGVSNWVGACIWKLSDRDVYIAHWLSKPSDKGTESRETMHGTATLNGTGKLAYLNGRTAKWSGLANGGSYFCDD